MCLQVKALETSHSSKDTWAPSHTAPMAAVAYCPLASLPVFTIPPPPPFLFRAPALAFPRNAPGALLQPQACIVLPLGKSDAKQLCFRSDMACTPGHRVHLLCWKCLTLTPTPIPTCQRVLMGRVTGMQPDLSSNMTPCLVGQRLKCMRRAKLSLL